MTNRGTMLLLIVCVLSGLFFLASLFFWEWIEDECEGYQWVRILGYKRARWFFSITMALISLASGLGFYYLKIPNSLLP